ncbi:hypothetical protein SADUNF_Sadunf02G0191800 [Salix dunnii]|uniref:Uncharacterized protein n=1 Tax=Salix dunnii TaxID=1413687 RepID=A0A835N950_9ROSI|nr:hypothetical protein SADUNF_Sadunf02G0191800 [Salix dunnii]
MPSWIVMQNITSSFRFLLTVGFPPFSCLKFLPSRSLKLVVGNLFSLSSGHLLNAQAPAGVQSPVDMGPCTDSAKITSALPVEGKKLWLARRPCFFCFGKRRC